MTVGTDSIALDTDDVAAWLRAHGAHPEGPVRATLIEGGLSNLTYRISDDTGARWVLRRPPLHTLDKTAHNMAREARILLGLRDTGVPVPGVVGVEEPDDDGPFYVMDHVDGVVVTTRAAAAALPASARAAVGTDMARVLARLHAVDPTAVGPVDHDKAGRYLARQIGLFRRQATEERPAPLARAAQVADALADEIPAAVRIAIVHGDYRLNNVITDPATGEVRAVLDWELSTVGDPLADLGGLLVHWIEPGDDVRPFEDSPTDIAGFVTRAEFVATYLREAGLPEDTDVTWYHAFGLWRLAIALDGVHRRFSGGAYGGAGEGAHVTDLPRLVPRLIGEAARLLDL